MHSTQHSRTQSAALGDSQYSIRLSSTLAATASQVGSKYYSHEPLATFTPEGSARVRQRELGLVTNLNTTGPVFPHLTCPETQARAPPNHEREVIEEFCRCTNVQELLRWYPSNQETWDGVTLEDGHIISISVPGKRVVGTLPENIGNLSELSVLDIDGNFFTGPLPTSLGKCKQLRTCSFSHNRITSIPPSLGKCSHLRILQLRQNLMKGELPPALGNLKMLMTLSLDGNCFNLAADVHITDVKGILKDLRKEWQLRERASVQKNKATENAAKAEIIKSRQLKRQNQQNKERAEVESAHARRAAMEATEKAWSDEDDDEW
jgi:hypothetical protein